MNDIEKVSDCCSAAVHDPQGGEGTAICCECKEHCNAVFPECPLGICDGSGAVQAYDPPIEHHLPATPAGTEPCLCQKSDDEYEPE